MLTRCRTGQCLCIQRDPWTAQHSPAFHFLIGILGCAHPTVVSAQFRCQLQPCVTCRWHLMTPQASWHCLTVVHECASALAPPMPILCAGPLKPAAAGTAACQLQYPSGSGNSVALARTPNAGGNAAAQNLITSPQAMGDIEGDHGLVPELDNQVSASLQLPHEP